MATIDLRDGIRNCPANVTGLGATMPRWLDNDLLREAVDHIEKRVLSASAGLDGLTPTDRLSLIILTWLYEAQNGPLTPSPAQE